MVFAEWEWLSPCENEINEPKKLSDAALIEGPQFCFLFSYAPTGTIERQLGYISENWHAEVPLLVSLVEFEGSSKRIFKGMSMHRLYNGVWQPLREQRALAWEVSGTRWA